MTPLEGHMPRILWTSLQVGAIIVHCEDEGWFLNNGEVIDGMSVSQSMKSPQTCNDDLQKEGHLHQRADEAAQ